MPQTCEAFRFSLRQNSAGQRVEGKKDRKERRKVKGNRSWRRSRRGRKCRLEEEKNELVDKEER